MPPLHAEFGSVVDLIGCVARSPEPRGDCLAFVVAGEELVQRTLTRGQPTLTPVFSEPAWLVC